MSEENIISHLKEVSFCDIFEYLYFKPAESADFSSLCEEVNSKLKSNWTYRVGLFYFGFHNKITPDAKLWEKKDFAEALIMAQSSEEIPGIYGDLLNRRFNSVLQWYAFIGIKPEEMPKTVPDKSSWIEMFDCALLAVGDFLRSFAHFKQTIHYYEGEDCKLEFALEWLRESKKETMAQIEELFRVYPIPANEKIMLTPDYKMKAESNLDFLNFLIKINFNVDNDYAKPKEGNKLYEIYEFWHKTVENEINRFLDYAKQTNASIEDRQFSVHINEEWDKKIMSYVGDIPHYYKLFNMFCQEKLDWTTIRDEYDGLVMCFPQFSCILKFNFSMEFFKYRGQEVETLLESEEFKKDMSELPKLIELHKNISEHIRKSVNRYIKTPKFIKFREKLKKM